MTDDNRVKYDERVQKMFHDKVTDVIECQKMIVTYDGRVSVDDRVT